MSIQAIILAGGEGSRLRPLTKNRPKVLLPVANRPILGYVLDAVVDAGIRDITVVVGYRQEQVLRFIADYKIPIETAVQKKQLGPYNAIQSASSKFHADQILILPGDNYIDAKSLKQLLEKKNAILVSSSSTPKEYGLISQENGYLTKLTNHTEAPAGSQVSCGAYLLERKNLETILKHDGFETTPDLTRLKISIVEATDWQDALIPACLLKLNEHVLSKQPSQLQGKIDKSAILRGHVIVGNGTEIGPNTVITGPVAIGENSIIHGQVSIGPGTSIGSRVTLEPFTYVADSIIMDDAHIGAQSRIVDSVIGEGSIVTNAVTATSNGIGAVIGDRATVGAFTQLKGTIIGNNAVIDGSKLLKDEQIPDDARVI